MTTVTLRDGSQYQIPTGPQGSWPWAREASLMSVAFQQAGDDASALQWSREYVRRVGAYNAIQSGADVQDIIAAGSWLDGPAEIVAYLAGTAQTIIDGAAKLPQTAIDLANALPLILLVGLAVAYVGFNRRSFKVAI